MHRCITKEKEVIKEDTKEGQSGEDQSGEDADNQSGDDQNGDDHSGDDQSGEDQSGEDQGSDDESFRAPKSKVAKGAFYSPGLRKSGWLSNGICLIH